MRIKTTLITVVILFGISFGGSILYTTPLNFDYNDIELQNVRLGFSFPPLRDDFQRDLTEYHLQYIDVELIRFAVDWSLIEPEQGVYKWNNFRERLDFCVENNLEVLLTFQSLGPEWVCGDKNSRSCVFTNLTAFEDFIEAFFTEFSDYNISKVQFGNEWASEYWFIGTSEEFVIYNNLFYDIVKNISPTTQVVLGGFAGGTIGGMAAYYGYLDYYKDAEHGKNYTGTELAQLIELVETQDIMNRIESVITSANYDMIDLHLYTDYYNWLIYTEMFGNLCPGIPLISTEMGGPNRIWGKASPQYQAQMLAEYFRTIDKLNITEVYYFQMMEGLSSSEMNRKSNLINLFYGIKPAYFVFQKASGREFEIPWLYLIIFAGGLTLLELAILLPFEKMLQKIRQNKLN